MEEDAVEVYTLGRWYVSGGNVDSFVNAWTSLAETFLSLPHPPPAGSGVLVQSLDDDRLLYSFGPWDDASHIAEMRADERAAAGIAALVGLCDEATPGGFRVVARA